MDHGHTGDVEKVDRESARPAQAGVKAAVDDDVLEQETLHAPPSYDPSTHLLGSSMPNGDDGDPSQQRATSSSEEDRRPFPTWVAIILLVISQSPLVIIIGSVVALQASGMDPLGFSFLAFLLLFSLVFSAFAIVLLVRISTPHIVESYPPYRSS